MPVVSRSDCTQTNVKESYTFLGDSNNVGATIDSITVQFQACQGANNNNNDLEAFVQQLVNDGKLSTTEQNIFKTRIVGNNNCDDATSALLADSGFEKGFEIDSNDWTFMVGEGSRFANEEPILHDALVKEMLEAQDISIVRRVCPTCVATHKDIYYRRLTPMPEGLNLLETLKNKWIEDNGNKFNEDFALYSSYMDAYFDMNRWTFCNFASDVGFPRDCGPTGYIPHQWNSYVRNGGTNDHAFMIPADPDFESEIEYEKFLTIKGTDYVEQKGTQVATGSNYEGLVGWYDAGDYLTYGPVDFGESGETKGIILEYNKGNDGGTMEIRLDGPNGQVIAEFSPGSTFGWGWDKISKAFIGIDDVEGVHYFSLVGKQGGGILNVASVELSDFADRTKQYAKVLGPQYSDSQNIRVGSNAIGYFDNGDYVTYSSINFGSSGTSKSILISYAKGNTGGRAEIRIGGPSGTLIATFSPSNTGGWGSSNVQSEYVLIDDVEGIHDVTFVGKDKSGVMNLVSFELSGNAS